MTDTIHSDPIITPALVREITLHDLKCSLDDLINDAARAGNQAWFIAHADEIDALARKAVNLSLSVRLKAVVSEAAA
jgi:hypothetical protein